ncbi:MAG: hypothetical protein NC307_02530 [Roseburia sp.]|nr:hypothetical protein [Roseburia sp.]
MKSKTSCFSKTIFRKNITHFWPIWSLLLLFYLFILPFMEFTNYLETKGGYDTVKTLAQQMEESILIPEVMQIITSPGLLFVFSLVAAGAVFSYLYTSRSANTMHAFPVTRTSLFITNYISGLLFLWAPLMAGGLLGILVAAGCGYSYLDILFKGLVITMGVGFFFYSFNVLVSMFVGQLIALPIFSFIVNFLFVGCKLMLTVLFASFAYGMTGDFTASRFDVLSPLYYLTGAVNVKIDYSSGWDHAICTGMAGGTTVAAYAAAAAVLTVIAFVLYRKRHLETAGSLIAVSWVTPVFRWGVGACFASLGALISGGIVAYYAHPTTKFMAILITSIIVGPVFFFAAEMMLQKSFRVFVKKRLKECGFFVLAMVVVLIFLKMDVFGIEKKVPKLQNVKEAYIRAGDCVGGDSEEDIAQIIALHETILSHKPEYQNTRWYEDGYGITVKYYLKDGSVLIRSYTVPANEEQLSDGASAASIVKAYATDPERYKKTVLGVYYKDNKYLSGSLEIPKTVSKDEAGYPIVSSESRGLTAEEAKKLYEAFAKDVEAGNFVEQWVVFNTEGYEKSIYWSSLTLSYTNEKGYEVFSDKFYHYNYGYVQEMENAYITFNTNCENMISALIDMGVINSADELLTQWEVNHAEVPEE